MLKEKHPFCLCLFLKEQAGQGEKGAGGSLCALLPAEKGEKTRRGREEKGMQRGREEREEAAAHGSRKSRHAAYTTAHIALGTHLYLYLYLSLSLSILKEGRKHVISGESVVVREHFPFMSLLPFRTILSPGREADPHRWAKRNW